VKRRKPPKRPRAEYLYTTTKGEVSEISLTVGPDGSVRFGTDMTDARIETTYDRLKKPKLVHRIGVEPGRMYVESNRALLANYDRVFAVDTNTRDMHGHRVSVTAVVEALPDRGDGNCPLDPIFFVEFLDVASNPEQLGWVVAAKNITSAERYQSVAKIAIVVDCDESNIRAYNERRLPVYRGKFLPERVTLMYATADTGSEYLANAAIRHADYTARGVRDLIATGRVPMNPQRVPADRGYGYSGVRTVTVEKLPDDDTRRTRSNLVHSRLRFKPVVFA
jgi:hypothetical protein